MRKWLVLFLDFLIGVGFVFPFVFGGVWIKREHLFVELTEVSVPVLVIAFFAVLFRFRFSISLYETFFAKKAISLFNSWQKALERNYIQTIFSAFLGVAALYSMASLRRHQAMNSGAADLGIFTNAIWNLVNGNGYISSVKDGLNLFADHQSPIFWLFTPYYYLFQKPETLLILQAVALASTGVIMASIARQYLSPTDPWSSIIPLVVWAYLPMRNANAFDFHPETLLLPLFLAAILGLQESGIKEKLIGFFALVLALACKESAGLVAVGIAVAWMCGAAPIESRRFTRILSPIVAGLGFFVFYFDTQQVPKLFGDAYVYQEQYAHLGKTFKEIVLSPILNPSAFFGAFFGKTRLKFLLATLAGVGFLPLFSWQTLIAALPGYAILFVSSGDHRVSLIYHYSIEASVGLFWALPQGVLNFRKLAIPPKAKAILLNLIFLAIFVSMGRSEVFRIRYNSPNDHHRWLSRELFPRLSDLDFIAPSSLVPHLANRKWAHHLPRLKKPNGEWATCVIYDESVNNWPMIDSDFEFVRKTLSSDRYEKEFVCGSLSVHRLTHYPKSCFKSFPPCKAGD